MRRTVLALIAACAAQAQTLQAVHSGARVRFIVLDTINLATNDLKYSYPEGLLLGQNGGRLLLRSGLTDTDTLAVSLSNIASAEQYAGRKRYAWQVGLAGMVAGGVLGYITGNSGIEKSRCKNMPDGTRVCTHYIVGDKRIQAGALGAGAGLAGGAIVGFFITTDHWKKIDPAQLRSF